MVLLEIAEAVKKHFNIPICLGGHHISALPKSLPKIVEVGVLGEAPGPLLAFPGGSPCVQIMETLGQQHVKPAGRATGNV